MFVLHTDNFQGGKGDEEAGENRNYLATRMTEEVSEIIRYLLHF